MKTPKFFAVLLLLSFFPIPLQAASRQTAIVQKALSGDTLLLKGGKELRYAGLEAYPVTPEETPCASPDSACQYGRDARDFNARLTEGKSVSVEWGPQLRDAKGQLMGFIFLDDGTFANREILRNGHAHLKLRAPNLRYAKEFREDELEARRNKRGLWVKEPEDPRLKADLLGDKFTKTYYFPNSPELGRVPEAQLVRFRSRVEAVAAGYKPCHSCRGRADESEVELDSKGTWYPGR